MLRIVLFFRERGWRKGEERGNGRDCPCFVCGNGMFSLYDLLIVLYFFVAFKWTTAWKSKWF